MSSCKCCGGETSPVFSKKVLGKHLASYVACTQCGSLSVSNPHWLDEAYADDAASDHLDEGAAWRNATAARFICTLMPSFPKGPWVDFGSGQGLLQRELAKHGLEISNYDPLRGVIQEPPRNCGFIGCFEVLEHQREPLEFMQVIASLLAEKGVAAFSTWLRDPVLHGSTWEYLAPLGGQHIFFPTPQGFRELCDKVGLHWWSTSVSQEHQSFQIHVISKRKGSVVEVEGFSVRPES